MGHPSTPRAAAAALAALSVLGCSGTVTEANPTAGPAGPTHAAHLQGRLVGLGFACGDCHSAQGFGVDFSQGTMARAQGASPTFAPATLTCSATYCHGSFAFGAVRGAAGAPAWTDPGPIACDACHAMPPAGHPAVAGTSAASCAACHDRTVRPDGSIDLTTGAHLNGRADVSGSGCTGCHGTAGRTGRMPGTDPNLASAPPAAPAGARPSAVGAHLPHLDPAPGSAIAAPVACAECHAVPADAAHATAPPAVKVAFGTLARTGGAAPAWDPATTGCSATHCHGNFTFGAVRGAAAAPLWTGAGPLGCTACHGMPPAGHPAVAGTSAASCSGCHPRSVRPDGTLDVAGHLNGKADVSAQGCTGCHGDASRVASLPGADPWLTSAPPAAPAGAPAHAVGAHLAHLNPSAATALAPPVACAECHAVPADAAHATAPPAQRVAFGTLARTGGAAPAWSAATLGCSATYCHGNFTLGAVTGARAAPRWTDAGPLGCTACHGMPPAGHPAVSGTSAASCSACHPQAVNRDGSVNRTGHLNGRADGGGCTTCHGDPPATGGHQDRNHVSRRCDACHPSGYTSTATVAAYHDNGVKDLGPQAGWNPATRTCANSCHGTERW